MDRFVIINFNVLDLVITGGTDGIGKALIYELVKSKGLHKVFLIGRNPKKLQTVSDELSK